jgi:hypothetical protein
MTDVIAGIVWVLVFGAPTYIFVVIGISAAWSRDWDALRTKIGPPPYLPLWASILMWFLTTLFFAFMLIYPLL